MPELSINERLQMLENEIETLKKDKKSFAKLQKSSKSDIIESEEVPKMKVEKAKKEKKPREKTAYNIFMSEFITEQKEKLGSDFKHKEAFTDGAKKWQEKKLQEIKK